MANSGGLSRRDAILQAATALFAERGYPNATIAELARRIGISDAAIYEHFESKEDILFSIPARYVEDFLAEAQLQLMGLGTVLERLRKLIWFNLHFYEQHRDYAAIILLELKHAKGFLGTTSHEVIRKFTRMIRGIIEEGQSTGEFRKDIDPDAARAAIIGGIEHVTFAWLLTGRPSRVTEAAEPLIAFATAALLPPPPEPAIHVHQYFLQASDAKGEPEDTLRAARTAAEEARARARAATPGTTLSP